MPETNKEEWDDYVLTNGGHPLQLWGWGEVKAKGRWQVDRVMVYQDDDCIGGAQILSYALPAKLGRYAYIPRGPIAKSEHMAAVLDALADYARTTLHAIGISVEPHTTTFPNIQGWRRSQNTILLARTLIIDVSQSEDDLLADMHPKRRADVRRFMRGPHNVRLIKGDAELGACLDLYEETAQRAHFALHDRGYYRDIHSLLGDHSKIYAAFDEAGTIVAFSWVVQTPLVAFALYGGINDKGRKLRANCGLDWVCFLETKAQGIPA